MSSQQTDTLYPCPFSKDYGISALQAWLLLKIFYIYRVISACVFVMLLWLHVGPTSQEKLNLPLYQFASLGYLAISLLMGFLIFRRVLSYPHLAQLFIFSDIVFITLLMHAGGGVSSGIGALLAVSIAAGGLLIGGRCAVLFAALATLAVLAEELYVMQAQSFNATSLNYSGVLGVSFFAIALLSAILAQRVEQSTRLAQQHAQTIARLEELNRYIIQHLQSGILLVDALQNVVLCNQSALRLLGLSKMPGGLAEMSKALQMAFSHWLDDRSQGFAIVPVEEQEEIQVRFSQLNIDGECLYMLLIEDIALHNQRLQQSKLASLGRLTASIAHEIRNPLSAISHAGQLLSETPDLQPEDKRLTEIIQNHCRRVNAIIEDILKLSRRKRSQEEAVALDRWLQDYVQELNQYHAADDAGFRLEVLQSNLNAYIDVSHLKQILDNLCSNALKYGHPERGAIVLQVDCIANVPCIRVIDHGDGLAPSQLQHLFEPFFTTSHQGTGLGLYISRELAELNKADLSYAKYHSKSCFILSLANADRAVIEI